MGNKTFNPRMVKYHINKLEEAKAKGLIRKVTITAIANKVGCTTNTLYKEFPKLIAPYMQSRKGRQKDSPNYGTLEYYKAQYEKRSVELNREKEEVRKLREQQMDYDMLMQAVGSLQEDKDLLLSKATANEGSKALSENLMCENAILRGQLLKMEKRIQELETKRHKEF